ncbi:MAG: YhbY family RNA-binding protein [Acidithiobacillus sp.]|uniref:YhbY family RNA-binding protein n=1 Tax=Acidithiobacillus sp. TaxID=1872118 RepID=UPI003D00E60F
MLSSKERQALKARAHPLQPVLMVGNAGLGPALMEELDRVLLHHELIKLRLPALEHEARDAMVAEILAGSGAEAVARIGRILILYRPRPPEPVRVPASKPAPTKAAAAPRRLRH